jgi:hypothetical protein
MEKPEGGLCTPFCVLQLLPDSPELTSDTINAERNNGSCLGCERADGVICSWSVATELTPAQKAARTRKRRAAARKMWQTRRRMSAWEKAHAAEAASKDALETYCKKNGWTIAFFEGTTRAPRTGIIDAIAFRLGRKNSDLLDIRIVQLKGGNAGVTGREIARLKKAANSATVNWLIAEFDGDVLHLLPDDPNV